jgi:hypothetical protein
MPPADKVLWTITTIALICSGHAAAAARRDARNPSPIAGQEHPLTNPATVHWRTSVAAQNSAHKGKRMTDDMFEFRHVSVSINRSPKEVYAFIGDGNNLAKWATGLGDTFQRDGEHWLVRGPLGTVRVRLAKPNDFGVADHTVTLESGASVHNPIRVISNGTGCTVTFTLMRLPGVSEQKFTEDAKWVEKDLTRLKALLENAQR